jgi:hypothetical protein
MSKTHWKKLQNPDYLGSWAIPPGKEVVYTIKAAGREKVVGVSGRAEECLVVHFTEKVKPMVVNSTNAKAITKLAGSPYIEDWAGVRIQLYVVEVEAFGDTVEAIRVRPRAPATRETLSPEHPKWPAARLSVQNGETTVEAIRARYDLSDEDARTLVTSDA